MRASRTIVNFIIIAASAVSAQSNATVTASTVSSTLAVTTTSAYPAGSTLSDGGYVCNPAHSYPAGQSCDGSNGTPTLVTVTGQTTLADTSGVVPATTAMTSETAAASWTDVPSISTFTGGAAVYEAPILGALAFGIMAFLA